MICLFSNREGIIVVSFPDLKQVASYPDSSMHRKKDQMNLARREQSGNGTRYFVKYQIPFLHDHLTFRREDSFSGISIVVLRFFSSRDVVLLKVLAAFPALTKHQLF